MPNEPFRSRSEANRPSKTVLICPDCGHESPLGGDWIEERGAAADGRRWRRYACPNCDAVISRRPVSSADACDAD